MEPTDTLTDAEYRTLIAVLRVQSHSGQTKRMRKFATKQLTALGCTVTTDNGNVYATKGNAAHYPTFVAHTDTVHALVADGQYEVFRDRDTGELFAADPVSNTPRGIGGDDKVGIFIALEMARELPAVKVALFRDEEIGCHGADRARMDFFENAAFVIECDRRGIGEFVIEAGGTDLCAGDWLDAIRGDLDAHATTTVYGMMTDVMTLKDNGLAVSCCNLACGYYQPHSPHEYIVPADVAKVLSLVRAITATSTGRQWPHIATPTSASYRVITGNPRLNYGYGPDSRQWLEELAAKYGDEAVYGSGTQPDELSDADADELAEWWADAAMDSDLPPDPDAPACDACGDDQFMRWDMDSGEWYCELCGSYQPDAHDWRDDDEGSDAPTQLHLIAAAS